MTYDPDFGCDVLSSLSDTASAHTVILGAGENTRDLLIRNGAVATINAVLDDDPSRHGHSIHSIPVRLPRSYPLTEVKRVIITSEMHEPALTRRASELFGNSVELIYTFPRTDSLIELMQRAQRRVHDEWDNARPEDARWFAADQLDSQLRSCLERDPNWRYGPARQIAEFHLLQQSLPADFSFREAAMLNVGCGRYHPIGLSLLAVLRGAACAAASDLHPVLDEPRAALAALDLVTAILIQPHRLFANDGPTRSVLIAAVEEVLQLNALAAGHLTGAFESERIPYRVESLYETSFDDESFDLIVSRDVFEHLPDVSAALSVLTRLLHPGGMLVAAIDFADHRFYQNPYDFTLWSHLYDTNEETYLGTNRLRFSDFRRLFDAGGFQIVSYVPDRISPIPEHVRSQLDPVWRSLPPQELAITRATAVLRRRT